MILRRLARGVLTAGLFAGAGAVAHAQINLVPPVSDVPLGSGILSSSLPVLTGGTVLASESEAFSGVNVLDQVKFTGMLYTAVIKQTNGTIDFLYQVHDTGGPDNITRMALSDFTGFTTAVQYFSDSYTGFGFVAPATGAAFPPNPDHADRNIAAVVGFDYNGGSTNGSDPGLSTGDITNVTFIQTNALNYTTGQASFIDGATANIAAYAPTTVPGPAAVIPMALGLLTALRRRKR